MDAQQLRELATNALTGFWPKHLGVNTDAERIEFLARKLERVADDIDQNEDFEDRALAAEEENAALKDEIEDLKKEGEK